MSGGCSADRPDPRTRIHRATTTAITGHRGARALWAENSLEGFRQVSSLGVDAVEFDVHLTDSGELVVVHDALLERTTDGAGPVRALTPQGRRQRRLRGSDETIPSLGEVLDVLGRAPGLELHIELKNDESDRPYRGLIEKVLPEIDQRGLRQRCHLASFDVTVLDSCRHVAPDVPRLVSVDATRADRQGGLERFLDRVDVLADVVAIHQPLMHGQWKVITSRIPAHRLCVWTVNEEDHIRAWFDRGVGHLTTDRPDLALSLRSGRQV
jgi:glycerophosphoryl diester phosphodiesterase